MTGKSDLETVIEKTERYTGKLENVIVSNMSGQFRVNKNINLPLLQRQFPPELLGKAGTVSYEEEAGIRTLGLIYRSKIDIETEVPIIEKERRRMSVEEAVREVLSKKKTTETKIRRETLFAVTFYKTGYIQFKGKLADAGDVVFLVRQIFDAVPECLIPRYVEVTKREQKPAMYKIGRAHV